MLAQVQHAMTPDAIAWRATASYLYVLHLDTPALAWEYLRRNRDYISTWSADARQAPSSGSRWGLRWLEDPCRDAREAQLAWNPAPDPCVTLASAEPAVAGERFSLWALPGHKRLLHLGQRISCAADIVPAPLRVAFDAQLREGDRFGYVLISGIYVGHRWRAVERHLARLSSRVPHTTAQVAPSREAMVHMRSLQALDGKAQHASHRQIAEVIFGKARVEEAWYPDSELRAQVRHLLRRAEGLVGGGYRRLLGHAHPQQGDPAHPLESPSARSLRTSRLHPVRCPSPDGDRHRRNTTR